MVFVAVGYENGPDARCLFQQVGHIGNDQVHARHALFWKLHAAVYDDNIVAAFHGQHVLANLAQPTQGNNAQVRLQLVGNPLEEAQLLWTGDGFLRRVGGGWHGRPLNMCLLQDSGDALEVLDNDCPIFLPV